MFVLFEEQRLLRAATILKDNDSALQVEMPGGRRAKIKSTQVLLRFNSPQADQILELAIRAAENLEAPFLWENCEDEEFHFFDLARHYFGHEPTSVEASALLYRLQEAPVYFHRRGKGTFRRAPAEILKAALAQQEVKRQKALQVVSWSEALINGECPDELRPHVPELLYGRSDSQGLPARALADAAEHLQCSTREVLVRCGMVKDAYHYHLGAFLFSHFPEGAQFPNLPSFFADASSMHLPVAKVSAFSIDSASTTEIDDAFSITAQDAGGWEVGVHIAAPGLGILPNSPLAEVARKRLSTVYFPGGKYTMFPEDVVSAFSLTQGKTHPVLSLYFPVAADFSLGEPRTCVEQVEVADNLRLHDLDGMMDEEAMRAGVPKVAYGEQLHLLWSVACHLEEKRGKAAHPDMPDFDFQVDWRVPMGHINLTSRQRGAPIDKLVSEWMILTNSTWGQALHKANVAALYRRQISGKVRMSTQFGPHEGLGVEGYAWCTSPLRRFCDLLNQWQLIALNTGLPAHFSAQDSRLFSAMKDFEVTYDSYAEFQRRMERYWSLRWLQQEKIEQLTGRPIKGDLFRLTQIPWVINLPGAACLPSDAVVNLKVTKIDLWDITLRCEKVGSAINEGARENLGEKTSHALDENMETTSPQSEYDSEPEEMLAANVDGER